MVKIASHQSIVLASASEIRGAMLAHMGIPFDVMPANIDEASIRDSLISESFKAQALALAGAKAKAVSEMLTESVVIGSDQICSFGDEILSKPGNTENAIAQLTRLSGQTHMQTSALAVYRGGEKLFEAVESAKLTMRPLSAEDIDAYVHHDNPIHSCGAYKFEALGVHLFARVEGDADTIYGMPLMPLISWLHASNILYFEV